MTSVLLLRWLLCGGLSLVGQHWAHLLGQGSCPPAHVPSDAVCMRPLRHVRCHTCRCPALLLWVGEPYVALCLPVHQHPTGLISTVQLHARPDLLPCPLCFPPFTDRVEVSAQNHNFAVDPATLPKGVEVSHINLNDGTCAGMLWKERKAMTIQYHPEASPGPHDADVCFEQFVDWMRAERAAHVAA